MLIGQTIGYCRVSTTEQRLDRQIEALGEVNKLFTEKVSGKSRERPALEELIDYARAGDTIKVLSMDRLARSLRDLDSIITELNTKGVTVTFIDKNLTFSPEHDDYYARFQLQLLGAIAELERSIILERQAEGIKVAKDRGVYGKPRRKRLTAEQAIDAKRQIQGGATKVGVARNLGVSRQTLYRALERVSTMESRGNAAA